MSLEEDPHELALCPVSCGLSVIVGGEGAIILQLDAQNSVMWCLVSGVRMFTQCEILSLRYYTILLKP